MSQPRRGRHLVRGHLALGERAVGEVPQRPLPRDRLVDARRADAVGGDRAVQGGVGRVDEPTLDGELAVLEQARARRSTRQVERRGQLVRVHGLRLTCCGGSRSGAGRRDRPGRAAGRRAGTAARPAAITRRARSTNARATGRLDAHPQRVRAVLDVLEQGLLGHLGVFDRGLGLDHDQARVAVPRQAHGADPELLVDGLVQRLGVRVRTPAARCRCARRPRRAAARAGRPAPPPAASPAATETTRAPSVAWRKKVRSPGSPTVPATNRLGRSNRKSWRAMMFSILRSGHVQTLPPPAPPPTVASSARRRRARFFGGAKAARSRADVVRAQHVRTRLGVADDRDRARVDDDALELVEVQAERVGQDGLDHVAVTARHPDRVVGPAGRSSRAPRRRRAPTPRTAPRRPGSGPPTAASGRPSTPGPWSGP